MKKRSNKILIIFLVLISVLNTLNILDHYTSGKKLQMVESNFIRVINLENGNEKKVKYSVLLGEDRGVSLYKNSKLGINLKDWKREYRLVFYKGDKKVRASVYTKKKINKNEYTYLIPEYGPTLEEPTAINNSFPIYDGRYAFVKVEGLLIDKSNHARFGQDFYDNLKKLDL